MPSYNTERYHHPELLSQLDRYLPERIRTQIEHDYYRLVGEQAQLDQVAHNAEFLADPLIHVATFSDHSVVHVRDVATNILQVLETINGVLIPARGPRRLDVMRGCGVMLAYNHDIGMRDFSAFGRAMHPEFAAQEVYGPTYDEIIQGIWEENSGNLAWRLLSLKNLGLLDTPLHLVLREILAMAVGHSKSKVPIEVLNDPRRLRQTMITSIGTDLQYLYRQQQLDKARHKAAQAERKGDPAAIAAQAASVAARAEALAQYEGEGRPLMYEHIGRWYGDMEHEAFRWLVADAPEVRELVADVVDTVRALRVADALRQRGTTLKTSAGYPIIVDQQTANAVIALQKGSGELFLLESTDAISSGEANIASTELTSGGDLRVAFARGAFMNQAVILQAAKHAALLLDDIQRDILETFQLPPGSHAVLKQSQDIRILIEGTDDNLEFADTVLQALLARNPEAGKRSRVVPSLRVMDAAERERYLRADDLDWPLERRQRALARLAQSGHQTEQIDVERAFTDVRVGRLREGETLLAAGAPPAFVYISMEEGLLSTPLGGYQAYAVRPWTPLGNTRVIRGATQEATVVAEREVSLLIIPKEIYLKFWHATYGVAAFSALLPKFYAREHLKGFDHILDILRQMALIDATLDPTEVAFIQKFAASYGIHFTQEELRQELLRGAPADFVSLQRSLEAYLDLSPPDVQVAQLRDLVTLFVKADSQISAAEALILAELQGMFAKHLEEARDLVYQRVLIVPQSPEQDTAIATFFPDLHKEQIAGGHAYIAGKYHSLDYAAMICERYRTLGFFTVVDSA
ncbi:MAG: hypothetical protein HGA45_31350 [Chloroflexales bacterium]|nr:hypothetical protein [Chloroflexales bacterium]